MWGRSLLRRYASEEAIVLTSNHNHLCQVKLNKPKALNALDLPMILLLQKHLQEWNNDQSIRVVFFTGAGGKAFCAGGDIRSLYLAKHGEQDPNLLSDFFRFEYTLDYGLAKMRPMQIAVYDGIVMGGGVGISIHAPIRIATENSTFAMPETAIGFFPDVGASYFLPRLQGGLGIYLGITGARLAGKQLVQAGIATHYVESGSLNDLRDKLIKEVDQNTPNEQISEIVNSLSQPVEGSIPELDNIQKYFANTTSVEHIHHTLSTNKDEWAEKKLKVLEKLSPLAMKVALEQIKRGKDMTLQDVFTMEYRLSQRFMQSTDFFEGVRASIIDKDKNPHWKYKTVFETPDEEVLKYFEKLSEDSVDLDVEKLNK